MRRAMILGLGALGLALAACGPNPSPQPDAAPEAADVPPPDSPTVQTYARVKTLALISEFSADYCEGYGYRRARADADVRDAEASMAADGLTPAQIQGVKDSVAQQFTQSFTARALNGTFPPRAQYCPRVAQNAADQGGQGRYLEPLT